VRFGILGPILVDDGDAVIGISSPRQRTLLAALAVDAGKPVSVDRLAETLWDGAPPAAAATTLRTHVMRLRYVLGPAAAGRLLTRSAGYELKAGEAEVDVLLFQALCRQGGVAAEAADWRQADQLLSDALQLWRGAPLADISSETLRADTAPQLDQLHLQALEWRNDAWLSLGRHREIVPPLQGLVTANPLRERFHAQLMLALYRSGRQADALAAFRRARLLIVEELGVEPGPELRELHRRMLAADESLEVRTAAATQGAEVVPRQLPATVMNFTGRERELSAMTAALHRARFQPGGHAVALSAISGTAGVGKTALAVQWAHQSADRFPDGQLYVNLRGYDPDSPMLPADALAGFLRALGVPGPDIPPALDDRAALYRSMLSGRRILVVLDNAGDAEQVRALLPGTSSCVAVITSRDSLAGLVARDGAARYDVDVLPHDDAVSLLRALIGSRVDAEPEAAAALAAACCRLPLALRVAAELAASSPDALLTSLAAELADHQRRLDLLDAGGDPRASARAVFSWSLRYLEPDAASAFRLAGLHPGPDFDARAAAALTGTSYEQARALLDQLARLHLVQPAAPGRYTMHDMLRDYACELATRPGGADDPDAALGHLLGYYVYTAWAAAGILNPAAQQELPACDPPDVPAPPLVDRLAAREWLDAELASLVAISAVAAEHGLAGRITQLAAVLSRYLDSGSYYAEARAIHAHARSAARQTGDLAAAAAALISLGTAEWRQGQYELATRSLHESLALYRQLGDQVGQARALGNLGTANLQQSRFDQAVTYYQEALALYRRLGDLAGQASSLGNLAIADRVLGRHQQATGSIKEALSIFRQLGNKAGEAHALIHLGGAEVRQGRYSLAGNHLRRARSLCRQAGDRYGEACVLITFAELDLELNRPEQAKMHNLKSLAIRREIGDRSGEADSLNLLGKILAATGRSAAARSAHEEALELATKLREPHTQARAHDGLGDCYRTSGDNARAAGHWRAALTLCRALGIPEADHILAKLAAAGQALADGSG